MLNLKLKALIGLFALLLGCTGYVPPVNYPSQNPSPPNNPNSYPPNNPNSYPPNNSNPYGNYNNQNLPSADSLPRSDSEYDERDDDPDRKATLNRLKRGDACEDERESHECYVLCKSMYKRKPDQEECAELTPDNIEAMYEMWQDLETGRLNNLENIDAEHFDWFLKVSIAGFDSLIRGYKRSEAEEVLVWIAENDDIAEVMRDEDDDFETLEELLSLVERFELDSVEEPFIAEIDRKTLFEYAIETGNDIAMDYFFDYFFQTHKSCWKDTEISRECLIKVCAIGASIDERDRDSLLDSYIFADFVKGIIKHAINGSGSGEEWVKGTGDQKIDNINYLDNSWANADWDPANASKPICGGLVTD